MFDLPLRKQTIDCPVGDPEDGVVLVMRTMDDETFFNLMESGMVEVKTEKTDEDDDDAEDGVQFKMPFAQVGKIFNKQIASGTLTIGGQPFDASNAEHLASLPKPWKMAALTKILSYSFTLPESSAKNSKAPEEPSPLVLTPAAD